MISILIYTTHSESYTLSLHELYRSQLRISGEICGMQRGCCERVLDLRSWRFCRWQLALGVTRRYSAWWMRFCKSRDRKSTRLNSSHVKISYAVFCLKKKKNK